MLPLAVTSAIAWLFPAAFFLLGLAMVLITLRARTARRRFEETAAQAPGEVTDMRWESVGQAGDRSMLAFPIVRFSLPDGRTVETRTRSGSNPPPPSRARR